MHDISQYQDFFIDYLKKQNIASLKTNAIDLVKNGITSVEEVYKEHCQLTKGTNIDITGLNYDRLKNEGSFQWPVPETNHSGTARLFQNKKFGDADRDSFT